MIKSLNHIGIAVKDLQAAKELYSRIFGVESFHEETVESQGVIVASFPVGGVMIELTAPANAESPIAKFIENRERAFIILPSRQMESTRNYSG